MQRMVVNHANRFDLLREAFNIPLKTHEEVQEEIKRNILDMVQNFSGDINVKGSHTVHVFIGVGTMGRGIGGIPSLICSCSVLQ